METLRITKMPLRDPQETRCISCMMKLMDMEVICNHCIRRRKFRPDSALQRALAEAFPNGHFGPDDIFPICHVNKGVVELMVIEDASSHDPADPDPYQTARDAVLSRLFGPTDITCSVNYLLNKALVFVDADDQVCETNPFAAGVTADKSQPRRPGGRHVINSTLLLSALLPPRAVSADAPRVNDAEVPAYESV